MIFTDGTHMVASNGLDELHEFAQKIGLKREWFQDHPRHPHYDITSKRMLDKAIRFGAIELPVRKIIETIRGCKEPPQ